MVNEFEGVLKGLKKDIYVIKLIRFLKLNCNMN